MARIAYPSDVTDTQWRLIVKRVPPAQPGGRHRSVNMREVINGILYLVRTGCSWRQLPHDFRRRARSTGTIAAFGSTSRGKRFMTLSAIRCACRLVERSHPRLRPWTAKA